MPWKGHGMNHMTGGGAEAQGSQMCVPTPLSSPGGSFLTTPPLRGAGQPEPRWAGHLLPCTGRPDQKGEWGVGVWVPCSAQDTSGLPLTWEGHPGPGPRAGAAATAKASPLMGDASNSPTTGMCHHLGPDTCACNPDKGHLSVETKVPEPAPWLCVCEATPPNSGVSGS